MLDKSLKLVVESRRISGFAINTSSQFLIQIMVNPFQTLRYGLVLVHGFKKRARCDIGANTNLIANA